jgi:hypothetical protein
MSMDTLSMRYGGTGVLSMGHLKGVRTGSEAWHTSHALCTHLVSRQASPGLAKA